MTSANREDIFSDRQWNVTLRGGVIKAFLEAVHRFKEHHTLEYVWFRFLPNGISDPFFTTVEHHVKQRLREVPIFRSTDGVYRLPSEVITIPPRFCDCTNGPLIPETSLHPGVHYLSPAYDADRDGARLKDLGICEMTDDTFIVLLQRMMRTGQFSQQSDAWHEAVCSTLSKMPRIMRRLKPEILQLRILPLSNGSWTSSRNAENVFFDLTLADIPNNLGIFSLKAGIEQTSDRYKLFEELGVKSADAVLIAGKILELHGRRSVDIRNRASLICDAKFMFAHRDLPGFPLPTNLRVMDEHSNVSKGGDIYMDLPGSQPMRGVLPQPPSRFIHPDYLKVYDDQSRQDWWQWLQGYLHVNVSPRLIGGNLSPEFVEMTRTLPSSEVLVVLQGAWPNLDGKLSQRAISQLAQMDVECEDGISRRINTTYIRRGPLVHFSLPFLPIQHPDDYKWNFLQQFGVSTEANGTFYIKYLVHLQQLDCKDHDRIKETYKQLEARFNDDPDGIR